MQAEYSPFCLLTGGSGRGELSSERILLVDPSPTFSRNLSYWWYGASGILTIHDAVVFCCVHRETKGKKVGIGRRGGAGFRPEYLPKCLYAAMRWYASSGCERCILTGCLKVTTRTCISSLSQKTHNLVRMSIQRQNLIFQHSYRK